jgi:hypothetical protein
MDHVLAPHDRWPGRLWQKLDRRPGTCDEWVGAAPPTKGVA